MRGEERRGEERKGKERKGDKRKEEMGVELERRAEAVWL